MRGTVLTPSAIREPQAAWKTLLGWTAGIGIALLGLSSIGSLGSFLSIGEKQ
jgi:hypothetical protein